MKRPLLNHLELIKNNREKKRKTSTFVSPPRGADDDNDSSEHIASQTHPKTTSNKLEGRVFFSLRIISVMPAQHPPKTSMEDHDVLPPPEAPVCQNTKITKSWKIETEKHHTHLYIKYVPVYAVYIPGNS